MRHSLLLASTALLSACLSLNVAAPEEHPTDPATETFAAATGVDLSKMTKFPNGVYYLDTTEGAGATLTQRQVVTMAFVAMLPNGFIFDRLNVGTLVDLRTAAPLGLVDGMVGMKIGGTRKLVIPSALGFGAQGVVGLAVPSNTTLVYDVSLLAF